MTQDMCKVQLIFPAAYSDSGAIWAADGTAHAR